jgi:hypothetical protein
MAIKTKELEVPQHFPPARIYLDDLQEIVEIFREARKYEKYERQSEDRETISFECGNKTCDTFDELKKLSGTNWEFAVRVDNSSFCSNSLYVNRGGCSWLSSGLSRDGQWATYRKLEALFRHRKVRWRAAVQAFPWWGWAAGNMVITTTVLSIPRLRSSSSLWLTAFLLYFLSSTALFLLAHHRHTLVVLQDYSEPLGFRGILSKSVPQIVGAVVAFFLGIVAALTVQYLHRKGWL